MDDKFDKLFGYVNKYVDQFVKGDNPPEQIATIMFIMFGDGERKGKVAGFSIFDFKSHSLGELAQFVIWMIQEKSVVAVATVAEALMSKREKTREIQVLQATIKDFSLHKLPPDYSESVVVVTLQQPTKEILYSAVIEDLDGGLRSIGEWETIANSVEDGDDCRIIGTFANLFRTANAEYSTPDEIEKYFKKMSDNN